MAAWTKKRCGSEEFLLWQIGLEAGRGVLCRIYLVDEELRPAHPGGIVVVVIMLLL